MKRDRFECEDGFAGLIHRFNIFLKPARGDIRRAELAVGVYDDVYAVAVSHYRPANVADKASVTYCGGSAIAWGADGNNVIGRSHVGAGPIAHRNVAVAGGVVT